jgi:hypothetical protein
MYLWVGEEGGEGGLEKGRGLERGGPIQLAEHTKKLCLSLAFHKFHCIYVIKVFFRGKMKYKFSQRECPAHYACCSIKISFRKG